MPLHAATIQSLRAVLFDWDGTLLDSYHADAAAYLAMFRALGVNWTSAQVDRHYSPDWYRVFRAAGIPRSRWDEADRLWRRFYRRHRPKLMPGARHVLRALAKYFTLGIVTSGNRARVARQLRDFRLTNLFAVRVCSEDASRRKPHPAPLSLALARLRLAPEQCLYVGDAAEDVLMARRAGVHVIGVFGPFPTHARLRASRPDALLASIEALPELILARKLKSDRLSPR